MAIASADPPHAPVPASSPAPDSAAARQAGPPCVAGRLDIRHVRDLAELVGLSPELHRYVAEARDRGQAAATASRPHQHLLLTGPSGCGKTYLAQVVAKALDMDLFLAGNLLRSTYSDGSALKLAAWLDQVEQRARGQQRLAYVLFDEAHVWLRQVDGHAPEDGKFVAFLLETLDGARAADYPHVVFMAATNYPDQLGPESRRRFVCADVGAPTAEQLSDHLRWCLRRRLGTQRTGPGSWLGDSGAAARLAHLGRYLLGLDRGDIARLVETLTPAAGLPNPEPLRQLIIDRRARAGALDGRHEKVGSTFDAAVRLPNITLADASPDRLAMFFGAGRPWSLQLLPSEPDTHGGLYLRCLQERAPTLGRIELTWAANPPAPTLVTAFSLDGRPGCGLWHVPLTQLREAGLAEAPGSRAFAERYERAHHGISVGLTVFVGHGGGSSAAGATRAVYDLGEARGLADGYETVTSGLAVRLSICRAPTPVSHDPVPDPVGGPGRVRAEVQLLRPGVVLRLLRDAHGWPGSATLYFGDDYLAGDTDCRLVARGGAANELGPLRVLRATLPAGETYVRLEPSAPRLLDLALARPGRDLPGAGRLGLLLGPVWPSDSDQQDREIDATLDWLATEFPNRAARPAQETGR